MTTSEEDNLLGWACKNAASDWDWESIWDSVTYSVTNLDLFFEVVGGGIVVANLNWNATFVAIDGDDVVGVVDMVDGKVASGLNFVWFLFRIGFENIGFNVEVETATFLSCRIVVVSKLVFIVTLFLSG